MSINVMRQVLSEYLAVNAAASNLLSLTGRRFLFPVVFRAYVLGFFASEKTTVVAKRQSGYNHVTVEQLEELEKKIVKEAQQAAFAIYSVHLSISKSAWTMNMKMVNFPCSPICEDV
jgi:hypothetical protein